MLGVRGVLAMCGSSNLVELGGFDSEPEAVCVFAKALKMQRPTVVHLRIGSGFKGVLLSNFLQFAINVFVVAAFLLTFCCTTRLRTG